jgi:murein DD-endopeptidase MepM/ murein hydrolase activator NlpD
VALALALAGSAPVGADDPAPHIEVRARELAPGEPLRVLVTSERPLVELRARFLGEELFLQRAEEGRAWSGWAMIPLDQRPGPADVEVAGVLEDGTKTAATRSLTIAAKEFPEERLEVESKYVEPPPEVQARIERERARLAEVYAARRFAAPPGKAFVRPVPGEPTAIFGTRRLYNGEPRAPHPGLDLRAGSGTPVKVAGDGEVVLAQDLYYSGLTVIVDHGGGLFTIYAHLSRIDVQEGATVAAGELVGQSGATGRVTGPHLHWGAKIGDRPFDPTALLDPSLFR